MFDRMMGNKEQPREAFKEKPGSVAIEQTSGGRAVIITINGNGKKLNFTIDDEKPELSDKEQVEDLVSIAVTKATEAAKQHEREETDKQMKYLLPFGFANLFGT